MTAITPTQTEQTEPTEPTEPTEQTEQTADTKHTGQTKSTRIGWAVSGLLAFLLTLDAVTHVLDVQQVKDAMAALGYPASTAVGIGVAELIVLALYVLPRTAPLGAVLMTGYLGGAVASQVRIAAPFFGTVLFPVYVGVLVWVGLYLRDARVRALTASIIGK